MKLYGKETVNLFGESCLDIMDKNMDVLVSLGDAHADKMREMRLNPFVVDHIIRFLQTQYPDIFPSNKKITLDILD